MKLVLFSGSLRTDSLNRKLLAAAEKILLVDGNVTIDKQDLKTLAFPVYDGDIEAAGIPENVKALGDAIAKADALIIASPEYNASISAPLKNAVDWISRLRPVPFERKPIFLMGASPGAFGSIRALSHARACFDTLGAYLYPQPFALPKASEAFNADGDLKDEETRKKLEGALNKYLEFAGRLSGK